MITLLSMQTNSVTCKGLVVDTGSTNHKVRLHLGQRNFGHVFTHFQVSKLLKGAHTLIFTAGVLVAASLNMPINSDGPCPPTMIDVSGFAVTDYRYIWL